MESYRLGEDPRGQPYYWLAGSLELRDEDPETDARALADGYVSITPLSLDLTAHAARQDLAGWHWRV